MKLRRVAFFALAVVASPLSAQTQEGPTKWLEDFEKRFPPVKKNAAAEELEGLAIALGIDWKPQISVTEDHPGKEDLDSYYRAPVSSWLEAQLKTSDDSISSPPPRLDEFLRRRQAVISNLTSLLAGETPSWGFDLRRRPETRPELGLLIRISQVLLSGALVEERGGHHGDAAQLIEASWSLYKSAASQPDITSQLIAIAVGKYQAGVLRKMSEPSFEWSDRMSGDEPRELMLEALQSALLMSSHAQDADTGPGSYFDAWSRAWRAVADGLRELSPCQISKLSDQEIWKPAKSELVHWRDAGTFEGEAILEIATPNLTQALRRSSRLLVDRELTARILQLRQEKSASRDGRWPEKVFDLQSRVCPEAAYEYQARAGGMSIQFKGSIDEPGAPALVLPLSFEPKAPRPTPTPTRPPKPVSTPTIHS